MRMFRVRETWIRQPNAWFSKPISLYFYVLGLFPFEVVRKPGPVMRWYPFRATWNIIQAFGTIILSYPTLMYTFSIKTYHRRLTFADYLTYRSIIIIVYVTLVVGTMVISWRVNKFFNFVQKINEIDVALKMTSCKSRKWRAFTLGLLLMIIGLIRFGIMFNSYYKALSPEQFCLWLLNFGTLNWITIIAPATSVVVGEIQNILIVRMVKFNQLMKAKVSNTKPKQVALIILRPPKHEANTIDELFALYLKLVKAAQALDDYIKEYIVVVLVTCFIQLVRNLFRVYTELHDSNNVGMVLFISLFLPVLAIMIFNVIEPSYQCTMQINLTKRYLSHMMANTVPKECRNKLNRFGYATKLLEIRVSACGLFQVDRSLFVSIADTLCSYVVFFIQMYLEEAEVAGL